MTLSADAETFLARLADELRPLPQDEREAVLLELRGHFEERQHQGPHDLRSAIDLMGSPAALARDFIEASAPAMRARSISPGSVYLPAVIANSNLPAVYSRRVPRLRLREMIGDLRATYDAKGDRWWSICVFLVAGFTVTSFMATLGSTLPDKTLFPLWLIYLVRLAIMLVAWAAAYRCMLSGDEEMWQLDMPIIRFGMVSIALVILQSIFPTVIGTALLRITSVESEAPQPFYLQPFIVLLTTLAMVAALRLQPWVVSLAVDRGVSPRSSWNGTDGKTLTLLVGWLVVVAPFYAVHLILALAAVHVPTDLMIRFGILLSILDGVTAMLSTLATALLNVVAYRWVVREPIPPARPFSSTRPSDALIAETNFRFRRFLAEKARRDMENSVNRNSLP